MDPNNLNRQTLNQLKKAIHIVKHIEHLWKERLIVAIMVLRFIM